MRLLTPFKGPRPTRPAPADGRSAPLWGQVGPPIPLPSPTEDMARDVPNLYRPQARASWQPLVADIGNPWFRVPQDQNLRLYEQLVETIPVLNAALLRIVQLVGTPKIVAEDKTQAEIHQWMRDVVVNRIATGFNNWFSQWIFDHLLYGRAHAELILPVSRRDIYAIQELHPRTIDLRPVLDGYSLDIVQIMAMRGMWITLNKRLVVTATHDMRTDMPHGHSLLYGLPFLAEIFTAMHKDQKRIWERFGNPAYHIRYVPPADLPDPTGQRSTQFLSQIMSYWNQMMVTRANGDVQDFATAGDIEVKVIGAAGEQLKFVEPLREIVSQLIAKTGLPPFMLGMQWQTTETMSAVEAGLLSQMVTQIREHVEPEVEYMIRLRQMLAGSDPEFTIEWEAPTLMDEFERARAELFNSKSDAQKLANAEDLWRLGIRSNLDVAREFRPELADATDAEVRAACPNLVAMPPAPLAKPDMGLGSELNPDLAGGGGTRSVTYGRHITKNGNGRH